VLSVSFKGIFDMALLFQDIQMMYLTTRRNNYTLKTDYEKITFSAEKMPVSELNSALTCLIEDR
jgi:hypothetical protein